MLSLFGTAVVHWILFRVFTRLRGVRDFVFLAVSFHTSEGPYVCTGFLTSSSLFTFRTGIFYRSRLVGRLVGLLPTRRFATSCLFVVGLLYRSLRRGGLGYRYFGPSCPCRVVTTKGVGEVTLPEQDTQRDANSEQENSDDSACNAAATTTSLVGRRRHHAHGHRHARAHHRASGVLG